MDVQQSCQAMKGSNSNLICLLQWWPCHQWLETARHPTIPYLTRFKINGWQVWEAGFQQFWTWWIGIANKRTRKTPQRLALQDAKKSEKIKCEYETKDRKKGGNPNPLYGRRQKTNQKKFMYITFLYQFKFQTACAAITTWWQMMHDTMHDD